VKPPAASQPLPPAHSAPPSAPAPPQPAKDTRYITIDFDNVDIQVFVRFISEMDGEKTSSSTKR
jgi:hypothetical protein